MQDILLDIRQRILNKEYYNEEHIRLSLVARIVQECGWNIWNPTEVYTEFKATKKEDNTRVDMALFTHDFDATAIFIECKALGAFALDLAPVERQLRDYNRDHTALFTVITDGQYWRFYFSFTSGEFKDKLFCKFDLLHDGLEDIATYLDTFLQRENILNQTARQKAEAYLMLGKKERAMQDVLPDAQKMVSLPPFPSLPEAMVQLLAAKILTITPAEAQAFLMGTTAAPRVASVPKPPAGAVQKAAAKVSVSVAAKTMPSPKPAKPAVIRPLSGAGSVAFVLVLNRLGIRATADWDPTSRRLKVRAGSTAMMRDRESLPPACAKLRKQLLEQKVLLPLDDRLKFQQDYEFESAIHAAAVICGYSVNGKQAWRDIVGKPLADYVN